MCRNIRTLYNFEPAATEDEIRAAALQYVRKISGFTSPSQANAAAFERAVETVARASRELQSAHDDRYRALLERTLAHLDSELAKLG